MDMKTFFTIFSCCVAMILTQLSAVAAEHEFRYSAPDATKVELMCEHNGWTGVPMTKGEDGVWTTKVSLSPGTYAYKFLVDGKEWVMDPSAATTKTVDNVENSAVEIKE
jgi:1,4-alpha-glucan branching enzyme